jgi:membrane protein implicated in regulation of membrane protease activity
LPSLNPTIVWFVIMAVLAIVEMATFNLVSIWFCFGALAAMLVSAFNASIGWQIGVFLLISVILLGLTRPIVKKVLKVKGEKTNADMVEGKEGIVLSEIDNTSLNGLVKVQGREWTAKNAVDNETIPVGARVKVLRIEGVKVVVSEIKE